MKITILTLFPEMFVGPLSESIIKRAQEKGALEIQIVHIRDFGQGKHKVVDDRPYGGGVGMVMKVDILHKAIESVKDASLSKEEQKVVFLDPRGTVFTQSKAKDFSHLKHLILLCGHYEGIDERARSFIDETISIGDFVVTGGEIPAMIVTDAVGRLVSGVLKDDATAHESFSIEEGESRLLEYPQYTTPASYEGMDVPEILRSGNHKAIDEWRQAKAKEITKAHRPDLLSE